MGEVLAQQQRLCPPPPPYSFKPSGGILRLSGVSACQLTTPCCRCVDKSIGNESRRAGKPRARQATHTTPQPVHRSKKVSRDPATTLPEASADLHVPPSTELSCLLGGQHELLPNHRSRATLTPPLLRAHVFFSFFFFSISRLICPARATKNLRLKGLLLLSLSCGGEAAGSLAPRARVQLPSVPVQAGFLDGDLVVALPSASSDK